jgi:uncharacterized membrane protein
VTTLFLTVKFVHIVLAIIAVGFNASYAIWLARAASRPEHEGFALRGVKFLDDWIANPAYVGLLLTGLLMVFLVPYPITTFWIDVALVLWLVAIGMGYGLYTPTLRKQIQVLESASAESAEYHEVAGRGRLVGILLGVIVLVIVALMVFKPHL